MLIWNEMTREEIAAARNAEAVVVVPVGAIEQHGIHLPVDTDAFLATEICRRAILNLDGNEAVLGPTLNFGFSPHHRAHAGTISLRLSTYLAVLRDIAVSILDTGFTKVLFVNGHGGNSAPLRSLVTEMVTDGHAVASVDYFGIRQNDWTKLLKGGLARPGHACEQETAISMALRRQDLVDGILRNSETLPPRLNQPWVRQGGAPDIFSSAGAAWPPVFYAEDCGYYGDPGAATPDLGIAILGIIVQGLTMFINDFSDYRPDFPSVE